MKLMTMVLPSIFFDHLLPFCVVLHGQYFFDTADTPGCLKLLELLEISWNSIGPPRNLLLMNASRYIQS